MPDSPSTPTPRRRWIAAAAALAATAATAAPFTAPGLRWPLRLQAELQAVDERHRADVGVYVLDLASGVAVSHRAEEDWYLASMVKVPVALAVLQAVDRGEFSVETEIALRADDYVDGAGQTNRHAPGDKLSVRFLIEQMIIYSDNTATDMLIELVGLNSVNALTQKLSPVGLHPITSLADVRRQLYGYLSPNTDTLAGRQLLTIRRQPSDAERVAALQRIAGSSPDMPARTLDEAYDAYYATGVNSGRLDAYAVLLTRLARGEVLAPTTTAYLLQTMQRVRTGDKRLKAGFPDAVHFAHKTGTQRARFCDAGIAEIPSARGTRQTIVVACASGDASQTRSERALRDVGIALRNAGVFDL